MALRSLVPIPNSNLHLFLKKPSRTASFPRRRASSTPLKERQTRDFVVPVPHGYLAGRQWGPDDGQPVLALHGWQDNLASFEALVPQLKREFRVVALDFSGHGLSSHLPPGDCYTRDQYVDDVRRTVDYLRWDTFCILGHGMGAGTGYFFSVLFPERVSRLISIEGTFPTSCPDRRTAYFHKPQRSAAPPYHEIRYTEYEIADAIRTRNIPEDSARAIMARASSRTAEGNLVLSDDVRVRGFVPDTVFPGVVDRTVPRFRNSLLVISKELGLLGAGKPNVAAAEALLKCVGAECCAKFRYVSVGGSHRVHLDEPEKVVPHVNDFLCT